MIDGGDIGNVLVSIQNIPQIGSQSHNRNPVPANRALHHHTASLRAELSARTRAESAKGEVLSAVREASK